MAFSTAGFAGVFHEKRLELKSLKGQTKAEELGAPRPELLSLRLSLKNGSVSLATEVNVSTSLATEYRLLSKMYSKSGKKYRSPKYLWLPLKLYASSG